VPGLLAAEDVAGAADLEVLDRDVEPGAQMGQRLDRLEPAQRISRSASAIWNPAPSSDALKIAWSRFRASSLIRSRRR
jgi:hypothetical protein